MARGERQMISVVRWAYSYGCQHIAIALTWFIFTRESTKSSNKHQKMKMEIHQNNKHALSAPCNWLTLLHKDKSTGMSSWSSDLTGQILVEALISFGYHSSCHVEAAKQSSRNPQHYRPFHYHHSMYGCHYYATMVSSHEILLFLSF